MGYPYDTLGSLMENMMMDIFVDKTAQFCAADPKPPVNPIPDDTPGPGTWPFDDVEYREERKNGGK